MPESYYDDPVGYLKKEAEARGMGVEAFALLDIAATLRWFVEYYSHVPERQTRPHESKEESGC